MNNPYDQLADAWDEGYAVGYREGNAQGETDGYELGYKQGRDDTRNEPKTNITRDQVIDWLEEEKDSLSFEGTRASVALMGAIRNAIDALTTD